MTNVEKLLATAEAEIGYLEKATNSQLDDKTANAGKNNYTKYARDLDKLSFYNGKKQGYAWCDVFVDWCFVQTFGETKALAMTAQKKGGTGAGCSGSVAYYKAAGRFYTANPQAGDQIFFTNSSGSWCHTGIVKKVSGGKVYTIEGNTSKASGVVANGGGVAEKSYSVTDSEIGGYGRPDYGDAGTTAATSTTSKTTTKTDAAKAFDKSLAGTYLTTASLNLRAGAGTGKSVLTVLPKGASVANYGYYTESGGVKWLYVKYGEITGFASGKYLKKK